MEQRSELPEKVIEYPSLIIELEQSMKERSQFIDQHHSEYQDNDGFKNKIEFRAAMPQVKKILTKYEMKCASNELIDKLKQ